MGDNHQDSEATETTFTEYYMKTSNTSTSSSRSMSWSAKLRADPSVALLASSNPALVFFTNRDLIGNSGNAEELWKAPEVQKMVASQQGNGCWKYPGALEHVRSQEDYNQMETYRILRVLVEQYAIEKRHPALPKAAEFLFNHQTSEGDIRGICGNQYVPYYSAAMLELLI